MAADRDEIEQPLKQGEYDPEGLPIDALAWWETHERQRVSLDALAERLKAEGRTLDYLEVICARDAVEVLQTLHTEVRGHRHDKQHQIDTGHVSVPALADRMLYECAGLPPVTYDEAAHLAWIEAVKACGEKDSHQGCDGCACSCHAYKTADLLADIAAVLTVYDEHVAPENRGPWRDRLAALSGRSET